MNRDTSVKDHWLIDQLRDLLKQVGPARLLRALAQAVKEQHADQPAFGYVVMDLQTIAYKRPIGIIDRNQDAAELAG